MFITYFIISFLPCEKSYCKVSYKNKNYLDNFLSFFNGYKAEEYICIIIYYIINSILTLLDNVTINKFTVCHLFFHFQSKDIINGIIDTINADDISFEIIIHILTHVFQIILTLIFLEIIEIKYLNLDENTKNNIQKRAIEELDLIHNIINDDDSINEELENEKNLIE